MSLRETYTQKVALKLLLLRTRSCSYWKALSLRDPVRSTHENFVKASGLRWVCVMLLLVEISWASRVWALPFLSALDPSERYATERSKRHEKITEWAWQLLLQVRSWYPEREIVAVADGAYASLKLLDRCRSLSRPVAFITRLRLDAAL